MNDLVALRSLSQAVAANTAGVVAEVVQTDPKSRLPEPATSARPFEAALPGGRCSKPRPLLVRVSVGQLHRSVRVTVTVNSRCTYRVGPLEEAYQALSTRRRSRS